MTDDVARVELGRHRSVLITELPPALVACVALIDYLNARNQFIIDTPYQQLVVATVLRSFDTFKAICAALFDRLATQAAMLCRPLFEDVVVAHWVVLNQADPDWLIRRFRDHRAAMALHQEHLATRTTWRFGEPLLADLTDAKKRQNALRKEFGAAAQRNWWDPGEQGQGVGRPIGIRGVAALIETAAERHERFHPRLAGGQEPLLRRMETVAYKWFTQTLHHTALGLPIDIVEPGSLPGVLGDPSGIVSFSAWWMFSQQIYLLHDLYTVPSHELDELVRLVFLHVFGASEEDMRRWPPDQP